MVEVQIGLIEFFQCVTRLVQEYLALGVRLGNGGVENSLLYTSELFEFFTRNLYHYTKYKNKGIGKYLYNTF